VHARPFSMRITRLLRHASAILGVLTLLGVAALLAWDATPNRFPAQAHDWLASLPLGLIAVVWIVHRLSERPSRAGMIKAVLLAVAFFFWAANQLWPDSKRATFWNDVAIALFILDVWLAVRERPRTAPSGEREL
jgi:hypothetical protein